MCTHAKSQLYRRSVSTLRHKLIKHCSLLLICGSACLTMHATVWTETFLCHSIEMRISLGTSEFIIPIFQHCKGKSMTYLEMERIFIRYFLILKHSSHPMIAFFVTRLVQASGPTIHTLQSSKIHLQTKTISLSFFFFFQIKFKLRWMLTVISWNKKLTGFIYKITAH